MLAQQFVPLGQYTEILQTGLYLTHTNYIDCAQRQKCIWLHNKDQCLHDGYSLSSVCLCLSMSLFLVKGEREKMSCSFNKLLSCNSKSTSYRLSYCSEESDHRPAILSAQYAWLLRATKHTRNYSQYHVCSMKVITIVNSLIWTIVPNAGLIAVGSIVDVDYPSFRFAYVGSDRRHRRPIGVR